EAGAGPGPAGRRLRPAGPLPLDHGRSRARYAGGAEGVCRGALGGSRGLGVPDGVAGRDPRRGETVRGRLPEGRERRGAPHLPDLADRPERHAARPVPRRALRARRPPPRSPVAPARGRASVADWLIRLVARVPASIHAKSLAAFLVIVGLLIMV